MDFFLVVKILCVVLEVFRVLREDNKGLWITFGRTTFWGSERLDVEEMGWREERALRETEHVEAMDAIFKRREPEREKLKIN